jgi:C4-dicarboxylate transporter DctM subunit
MDYGAWVAILTFIGMFACLLLGMPIFISLLASAFVGSWLIGGLNFTLQQFTTAPYYITATYSFAVIPLFILMSVLAARSGLAQDAYDVASKWLGRLRGGLLMATVGSGAVFGAACGSSLASAAVFTKTALPELKKLKYDTSTSMGCVAAAGSLASLIPPSVGILIVCIIVDASIGRALVAGIIPGIFLAVLFMLTIQVIGFFKPKAIPRLFSKATWKERLSALVLIGPIIIIVLLVIGGMYFGVFPPTIGGAIGSAAVLVVIVLRRVNLRTIADSFSETVILNAQIFPLIIAGFLFARFIGVSRLPNTLLQLVVDANFSPLLLMLVIVIFYLFIGCVLEFTSMGIITLPIVYPLLTGVGFDPIALIIVLILLAEIAFITPPIGMNVFLIAGIERVSPEVVFRGVLPFFVTCLVMLWLLVLFPKIATWLPDLFYGRVSF